MHTSSLYPDASCRNRLAKTGSDRPSRRGGGVETERSVEAAA